MEFIENTKPPGEEWRPISGFEDKYLVSNYGRVKSVSRDYKYGSHDDIIISQNDRRGYRGVTLFSEGKRFYFAVHRLVAAAFIPNPHGLPCVNHKDENKANNNLNNLEWCTHIDNSNYGTSRQRISKNVSRKVEQLTADTQTLVKLWSSLTEASRETGACISEISKCCKNQNHTAAGYKWRKYNA